MIVRTWRGRVPLHNAEAFRQHLIRTGVQDYRNHTGCADIALWRRDVGGWAIFTLVSTWKDWVSVTAYTGADPAQAVHYAQDAEYGLIPDGTAMHHQLVALDP